MDLATQEKEALHQPLSVFNDANRYMLAKAFDDPHSGDPEFKQWNLVGWQLKNYLMFSKTRSSQLADKQRGGRKHRKTGNYVAHYNDEWLNPKHTNKKDR